MFKWFSNEAEKANYDIYDDSNLKKTFVYHFFGALRVDRVIIL